MTISGYLNRKYSYMSKLPEDRPFTCDLIALELQVSETEAYALVKEHLGRGRGELNYYEFEQVICSVLDLE